MSGNSEEYIQPVSSLRSKFEQLAAASAANVSSNGVKNKSAATSQSNLLLPEDGHPRARWRSAASTSEPDTEGDHLSEPSVRASPSSPHLGSAFRRKSFVENGSAASDSGLSTETPPLLPPAPPPRRPSVVQTSSGSIPSVVVNPAPASSRKPPPPPPPLKRRKSGELDAGESQGDTQGNAETGKYTGLQVRFPGNRAQSPVARSSSAPLLLSPRRSENGTGDIITTHAGFTDSPPSSSPSTPSAPPLPARPSDKSMDETKRAMPPIPSPLRHRPAASTGTIKDIPQSPPPLVPPRPIPPHTPPIATKTGSAPPELPPPLPNRPRVPSPAESEHTPSTAAPPLPFRRPAAHDTSPSSPTSRASLPPSLEPKPLSRIASGGQDRAASVDGPPAPVGSLPHRPPPTRTIALGEKLPPVLKRTMSEESSDSAEEEEEEPDAAASVASISSPTSTGGLKRGIDDLPDATHSNRRPPALFPGDKNIHLPGLFLPGAWGVIAASGNFVCVGTHTVRVYDIGHSTMSPTIHLGLEEMGLEWLIKEPRVTAMEFRPGTIVEEEGRYLWCGTKDGHLFELDVWTGNVTDRRSRAHASAVWHIFRYARSIITIEEGGKMYIFDPDSDAGQSTPRMSQNPRLIRIAERQVFARVLGREGQVWTSEGTGGGGTSNVKALQSTQRGPYIRVYAVKPATVMTKPLLAPDLLGAVTAGCILPSQPDVVYLGHEGGSLSIWTRNEEEPSCVKTVKIGPSDILTLDGVMSRLWIGNRQGLISAYDVSVWPWQVTNVWRAHGESPVSRVIVDVQGVVKSNRLLVVSIGRDDRIRFWDGLLATHWINDELLKREEEFSSFRTINVLICTWNVDAAKPEALTGTPENATFFEDCLRSAEAPDIIVFSFQEIIDLENRKLTAKTVLLGSKKTDKGISEKVSRHYKLWYDRIVQAIRVAAPPDQPYKVILSENLVGLFTCIFVRASQMDSFKDPHISTIKRGMGGMYGNKGAIVARFTLDDSSLCFINCHLAAGQSHVRNRNSDLGAIMEEKSLFPEGHSDDDNLAYGGGGDGSMVLDHEICFANGDMNYRIDQRREAVIASIRAGDFGSLLAHDQLLKEMKTNPGFRLRGFSEAPITFAPTYKYDRRSNEYDSSGKKRTPAWCDRILYRSRHPSRVQVLHYRRYEANISDHRPVSAAYRVTVKSLTQDARLEVKRKLEEEWKQVEKKSLDAAFSFYVSQGQLVHT